MIQVFRLLAVSVLWLSSAGAAAQSKDDAKEKFNQGEFLEAAEIGEALGTSESYALAARALGVYGHYLVEENARLPILTRAIELAEAAIKADSTNAEAYHQAAHVVGRYAENIGKMKALQEGVAAEIRDFLQTAVELDPNLAEAHVALGNWYAEVAGNRMARWLYGGDKDKAIHHLERALELAPTTKAVLYEYGTRIADLDSKNGKARAREVLTHASEIPAQNAYEEFLQEDILFALAKLGLD